MSRQKVQKRSLGVYYEKYSLLTKKEMKRGEERKHIRVLQRVEEARVKYFEDYSYR